MRLEWLEFGEELRKDRELRDVSREQLAEITKVSARQIEALETGRLEQLPALVFSRGFVAAIAKHLGLDSERTVAAFTHVYKSWAATDPKRKPTLVSPSGTFSHVKLGRSLYTDTTALGLVVAAVLALATGLAAFVKSRSDRPGGPSPPPLSALTQSERPETGPGSLALPPAVAAATVAMTPAEESAQTSEFEAGTRHAGSRPPLGPAGPADFSQASPARETAAIPSPSGSSSAATAALASQPLAQAENAQKTLTLKFSDDCWTEVRVDGKVVAAETFRKGDVRVYTASRRFSLTLGNAGGVEVAVDGRAFEAMGGAGKVIKNFIIGDEPPRRG